MLSSDVKCILVLANSILYDRIIIPLDTAFRVVITESDCGEGVVSKKKKKEKNENEKKKTCHMMLH